MTDAFVPATGDLGATSASDTRPLRGVARWLAALRDDDPAAHRHVLLLRFAVVNLVAFALLGAAWFKGWVGLVLAGDSTRLVAIIGVVFLAGLTACAHRLIQTSAELGQVYDPDGRVGPGVRRHLGALRGRDGQSRAIVGSALKLRLAARIAPVRHVANSLVFLGLIGTVLGFIIALSGVDAGAVAEVEAIGPMVTTLIGGMSVALYTTLVGAVLNIWLMVNYRLLESGTVRLFTALVELGEQRHA